MSNINLLLLNPYQNDQRADMLNKQTKLNNMAYKLHEQALIINNN